MEEIQVQFLRHFEQSQKNHYCSREEPLWGQLAAEGWRAFKENSLHFKTMIFWGEEWGAEDKLKGGHIATYCRKTDLLEKTLTSLTFRQQNVNSQICSS